MRIGTLSRRTGASVRMIRYYAAHGLLEPRRSANGYREFTEDDVAIVEGIRCLLASGLNVVEARRILEVDCGENPDSSPDELHAALGGVEERHNTLLADRARIDRELTALTELRELVRDNAGKSDCA